MKARPVGSLPTSASRARRDSRLAAPYHWQIAPNRDLTLTPHLYTGVLPAIEAKYRQLDQMGRVPARRLPHLRNDREASIPTTRRRGTGVRGYFEANGKAQLDPLWSITSSLRVGDRQDSDPSLRHHQRRPAAQRRQRRADRAPTPTFRSPAGHSRACAPKTSRSKSRSPSRRSTRASARRTFSAAPSRSRPTAFRSSGSRARTRSAPSPAPNGI